MLLQFILFLALVIIIYQDFSARLISWWTIPFLGLIGLWIAFFDQDWEWIFLLYNLGFMLIQWVGICCYFSIKNKRWINPTKEHIGIGDLLFFMVISPLFAPLQFFFFFISSLVLILCLAICYQFFVKKLQTIPLAGAMSLCLMAYFITLNYYQYSPYNDWFLFQYLYG